MKNRFDNHPIYPKIALLAIVLIFIVLLAACKPNTPAPVRPTALPTSVPTQPVEQIYIPVEKLFDTPWVLVGYGDPVNPTVLPRNTLVTAIFSADGGLAGNSACNQYNTTFEADETGMLAVKPEIATTRMACPENIMAVEQTYLQALAAASNFTFGSDSQLEIGYTDQQGSPAKLFFALGQAPLTGMTWTLSSYGKPDNLQSLPADIIITANFGEDGILGGSAGCNTYATPYTVQEGRLSLQPAASTMMLCASGMEQEQAFLGILNAAEKYEVTGKSLVITAKDGQVLSFSSRTLPLESTLWTLVTLNEQSLPTRAAITLSFQFDSPDNANTAGGIAGCNSYSARYTLDGDSLSFSDLASTLMVCEDAIMQVEKTYLDFLSTSQSYQVFGNNLVIIGEGGTATFVADRTPLTGALWVLRAIGDKENPRLPVEGSRFTAQFTAYPGAPSGVVAGTTGCNEYAAAYAASDVGIKINPPQSTNNKTCVPGLLDQEMIFLLALNNATEYRLTGNTLQIPFDGDKQVLIFDGVQIGLAGKSPLSDLQETRWYLWTINDQLVLNGTTLWADFSVNPDGESGKISGSAGCNLYQAIFGNNLGVQTSLSSKQLCSQPKGINEQEIVYLQALGRAYGYWLTGDQLILNTGGGALTYRQAQPPQSRDQTHLLQSSKWFLVSYNTTYSAPGAEGDPSLRFATDGSFTGYTGCNQLQGRYSTNIDKIRISEVSLTKAACINTVMAAQETAMLAVLNSAQTYQVYETTMQLVGAKGVLNFKFAPVNRPEDIKPPVALITAPVQAKPGEVVRFDASQSSGQVSLVSYKWDFGDGAKGSSSVVEHVYRNPGSYYVQMTVTDARGYRNSAAQFIEILAPPEPTAVPTQEPAPTPEATSQPTDTPTPELLPPQAAINGPAAGFPGEPILFDAGASVPGSSPIGSYHWDFGDGTTSGPSADTGTTKIYNRAGTYDVSLIVTDQNGLSSSAPLQVAIQARLDSDVWSLLNLLDQPLVPGTAITAQFMNGAIAGFAGCNSYSGTYTAQENPDGTYTLAIRDLSTSRQTCPEEVMRQEQLFLAQFATVLLARVDQMNTLILSYPEGIAPNGEPYNAGELTFYDRGKPTPR